MSSPSRGGLQGITLIIPPVSSPTRPYPSVPQLTGYLRRRGIPVRALDANIAFCRHFLQGAELAEGAAYGFDRLRALDGKESLSYAEMVEYLSLARAGAIVDHFGTERFRAYIERREPMPKELQGRVLDAAARLVLAPHFPESIRHNDEDMQFAGRGNPYSSAYLLEAAEEEGLFGSFFEEWLAPFLRPSPPLIAGLSVVFPGHIVPALRIARAIRKLAPRTAIVFGGPFVMFHLSRAPHDGFFRYMDYMVVGDGEVPLVTLYEALRQGSADLSAVPGLIYREDGRRQSNPEGPHLPMDEAEPDYSDFPTEDYYRQPKDPFAFFRLSRGCSWARCAFCRTGTPLISCYQEADPDRLFEQVRSHVEERGTVFFPFTDDEASPERVEAFARRVIDERLPIEWSINMRMDSRVTLDRCRLFREAGCINLIMGLESFHDRLLKLIAKGITVPLIEKVLSNVSWAGLRAGIYMIVGLPTETVDEAEESFRRIFGYCREGDVSYVFYSPYQVLSDSSIGRFPGRYGITDLNVPEGLDLDPPNVWFKGEGMSRRDSFSLMQRYSWSIWRALGKRTPPPLNRVRLGGEEVELHYDLAEMAQRISGNVEPYLAFGEYLENGEKGLVPLRRRTTP